MYLQKEKYSGKFNDTVKQSANNLSSVANCKQVHCLLMQAVYRYFVKLKLNFTQKIEGQSKTIKGHKDRTRWLVVNENPGRDSSTTIQVCIQFTRRTHLLQVASDSIGISWPSLWTMELSYHSLLMDQQQHICTRFQ